MQPSIPRNETLEAVFLQVRNLIAAEALLAAGIVATRHEWDAELAIPTLISGAFTGYLIAAIGSALVP
jgi:hypothetical protein